MYFQIIKLIQNFLFRSNTRDTKKKNIPTHSYLEFYQWNTVRISWPAGPCKNHINCKSEKRAWRIFGFVDTRRSQRKKKGIRERRQKTRRRQPPTPTTPRLVPSFGLHACIRFFGKYYCLKFIFWNSSRQYLPRILSANILFMNFLNKIEFIINNNNLQNLFNQVQNMQSKILLNQYKKRIKNFTTPKCCSWVFLRDLHLEITRRSRRRALKEKSNHKNFHLENKLVRSIFYS